MPIDLGAIHRSIIENSTPLENGVGLFKKEHTRYAAKPVGVDMTNIHDDGAGAPTEVAFHDGMPAGTSRRRNKENKYQTIVRPNRHPYSSSFDAMKA